jgi:anti-sigma regulatory factor (Ser/Thr protein kinase)
VTNAVVHGGRDGRIYLNLVLYDRHAHVSVRNLGRPIDMGRLRTHRPDHGHGLNIVSALADSWAIEAGPAGTIVSARIPRDNRYRS